MPSIEPVTLAVVAAGALVGIAIGMVRRESPWTIALDVGGSVLYLIGLLWAGSISREASLAALLASLGVLMFTVAYFRHRRTSTTNDARVGSG